VLTPSCVRYSERKEKMEKGRLATQAEKEAEKVCASENHGGALR